MLLVVATNLVAKGEHVRMVFWDPCFSISLCKDLKSMKANFPFGRWPS